MPFHRFKIGQQVVLTGFGVLTGPYEITRLLPLEAGVPYYRAKKLPDGRERAISELSLRSISQLAAAMRLKLRNRNPGVAKYLASISACLVRVRTPCSDDVLRQRGTGCHHPYCVRAARRALGGRGVASAISRRWQCRVGSRVRSHHCGMATAAGTPIGRAAI